MSPLFLCSFKLLSIKIETLFCQRFLVFYQCSMGQNPLLTWQAQADLRQIQMGWGGNTDKSLSWACLTRCPTRLPEISTRLPEISTHRGWARGRKLTTKNLHLMWVWFDADRAHSIWRSFQYAYFFAILKNSRQKIEVGKGTENTSKPYRDVRLD